MPKKTIYAVVIFCTFLWGCNEFPNPFAGDKILAKVGDRTLSASDCEDVFTPGISPDDSIKLLESYVNMWVRKQLKTREAEKIFRSSEEEIERMVEDYRSSLLGFRLDQYYVDRKLDTTITGKNISEYYESHKNEFTLDRDIVKGTIVIYPDTYRQKKRLSELINASGDESRKDFTDLCKKNDLEVTEVSSWVDFSDFTKQLPPDRKHEGFDHMLVPGGIFSLSDKNNEYLVYISDCRRQGDPSPLERVSSLIRRSILNLRQTEIIRLYEDSLYKTSFDARKIVINLQ